MKKFLYGRLHDAGKGYDFYIRPEQKVDALLNALSTDMIRDEKRLLFLQNLNGRIILGVREQLTLKDHFGRLRANFMGYQLEPHETALTVPFLDALQAKIPAITAEAHECHRLLDEDSSCGDRLRDTDIKFDHGHHQAGNDWDAAVMFIRKSPGISMTFMFDEHGRTISVPGAHAESSRSAPAEDTPPQSEAPRRQAKHTTGIVSTVTLNDDERIKILPPPVFDLPRKKETGFLEGFWKCAQGVKNLIVSKKRSDDDFFPPSP